MSRDKSLPIGLVQLDLQDHLVQDTSFPSAYFRALGAIASSDNVISLAEYAALNDVVRLSEESALAGVMLLHSLEHPTQLKDAFAALKKSSVQLDKGLRKRAFEATRALLKLQGHGGRSLARQLGSALALEDFDLHLDDFASDEDQTFLNKVVRGSLRMVKGNELRNLAERCVKLSGDIDVAQQIIEYENGKISVEELRSKISVVCNQVAKSIDDFEEKLEDSELSVKSAQGFLETALQFKKQVGQRLAMVDARLNFERETFSEDIDEAVHDAGNSVELEISNRLKTDQWKSTKVWESIGTTTFAKELERRIGRITTRREEVLKLMKEDLRLFQEEMKVSRISILQRHHHSHFAKLMPTLRPTTRVINAIDDTASATLTLGTLSAAGAGAAMYFLGAGVVLPIIAPVAPFVGGAMLLAGVFKWMTDSSQRKDGEIGHKREAFEKELRSKLDEAQINFNKQLDEVASEFMQTSINIVQPILLEAQAADRLASLQVKMAQRLISSSRKELGKLTTVSPRL